MNSDAAMMLINKEIEARDAAERKQRLENEKIVVQMPTHNAV